MKYFANSALLPIGWAKNVLITVDENGWITDVQMNQANDSAITLPGFVLPGMPNVHSHAFQFAMAGMAEHTKNPNDNFWTWREIMYKFLSQITPEDQQAISSQLYIEMLKAGYTTVGEFHYVHHQPSGMPYEERTLTSQHIITAAQQTGIGITFLPVLYAYSGFGGLPPSQGQKRFINNEEQILSMISSLKKQYENDAQITLGVAPHSLRAVTSDMLQHVIHATDNKAPIHIHAAEQMKEVNECIAWCGKRPVEWLLENVNLNSQWCLIHATHMTKEETQQLAQTGAVAGLCPTTEANLGDGLFNLKDYIMEQGNFGIGTDSQISINVREELKLLEYSQRLFHQERIIAKSVEQPSTGTFLYQKALSGGSKALGRKIGSIAIEHRADFISLDEQNPALLSKTENNILDAMIFATNNNPIRHVIVGGKHVIKDFHHHAEENIFNAYSKTLAKLSSEL